METAPTTLDTTQTTTTTNATQSQTGWHALIKTEIGHQTLTARTRTELKKLLNTLATNHDLSVLATVKGRLFPVQEKKTFEFGTTTKAKTLN